MKRNSWAARCLYGLTLWLSGAAHHILVGGIENTPEGMFVYHLSAAATDYMLLISASSVLAGRLVRNMQALCFMSMIVNFAGWVLYMAYSPPSTYDYAILGIGYVQFGILFTVGLYGTDRVGDGIVRGPDPLGPQLHVKEAK